MNPFKMIVTAFSRLMFKGFGILEVAAVGSTVLGTIGMMESRKARKQDKKLRKQQEEEELELRREEAQKKMEAKKAQMASTRGGQYRARQRGRMSTILGSSGGSNYL